MSGKCGKYAEWPPDKHSTGIYDKEKSQNPSNFSSRPFLLASTSAEIELPRGTATETKHDAKLLPLSRTVMTSDDDDQLSDEYIDSRRPRKHRAATLSGRGRKKRQRKSSTPANESNIHEDILLSGSTGVLGIENDEVKEPQAEIGEDGTYFRPISPSNIPALLGGLDAQASPSVLRAITERKLKLEQIKYNNKYPKYHGNVGRNISPLEETVTEMSPPSAEIIDELSNIQTTPFENSFLSRLQGTRGLHYKVIAVDWETETPWISLMNDIRDHHAILHPDRETSPESPAPIMYTTLQPFHLQQVHDLLERVFWTGINVSDSLEHSPEQCTVVAMYKSLVVGIAILSSPRETYITYLAVRAGWDNSGIARSMLYHLIAMNPNKDITLHVSVNNPAMLLYNQFGFKAEEFVAGFYEEYLDRDSRASKNAFRLRLRQQ